MDEAPVRVQARTGNGAHIVLHENEWPIARTQYRRWYLDARQSEWQNDSRRSNMLRISETAPAEESSAEYDAYLDLGTPTRKADGWSAQRLKLIAAWLDQSEDHRPGHARYRVVIALP